MKTESIHEIISILKEFKDLRFNDFDDLAESKLEGIQKRFGEGIDSLSDLTIFLLSKKENEHILNEFDKYGKILFEEIKKLKEEFSDPYYEYFFIKLASDYFPKKNEFFSYLAYAFYYALNPFTEHEDPSALDECVYKTSRNGMLHLLAEYAKEPLLEMLCNCEGLVEGHFEICEGKYPERLEIFLQDEDYNDYLPDGYRKEED
ncbi:hypothetical protein [Leptospira levettii]|uniref:hypothetical protein n=1 Tax=Leptospira levettii TaxID=2023178 RepID=UPI003EBE2FBF